jgi:hypothetical protein
MTQAIPAGELCSKLAGLIGQSFVGLLLLNLFALAGKMDKV